MVIRNWDLTNLNGVIMRKSFLLLPIALVLGVAGTALVSAQPNPGATNAGPARELPRFQRPAPNPEQLAQRRAELCKDMNARAAGRLAYLETRLELTANQRPAFNKWRDVRLAAANSRAQACTTTPVRPGRGGADAQAQRPSPVDRMARQEQMLRQRLATITAERPALEALYNSLTAEQRARFQPDAGPRRGMGRGPGRERGGMMQGRMGGPRGGMMMRGGPRGPDRPQPPAQ
jgi:protein CpxP